MNNQKIILTIEELTAYLNTKKSHVRSLVFRGEIPHLKIGRLLRFNKEEIDEWLTKNKGTIHE